MRKVCGHILVCLCAVAEPVLHAFGIPHVEGMSAAAINYLNTKV